MSDAGDDPADGEEGEGRETAAVVVGGEEVGEGAGDEGDGDADEDGSDELGAEVLVLLLLQVERDVVEHFDDGEGGNEREDVDDRAAGVQVVDGPGADVGENEVGGDG